MSSIPPPGNHAYRADIDGLRALAVLPVLLYHANVPGFSGGFIGVDIFFVISGYLITHIIVCEIDAGTFSILNFYERRARRILPALFAVIAFVLVAAGWFYLPNDFVEVSQSALAALGFLSNVWLFLKVGYFERSTEIMPLLHTWSLGVEEQFYVAFPILLVLIARFVPCWRLQSVLLLALISFIWALAKQADTDSFAFYLLPPRAWEILIGALLALGIAPPIKARWVKEILCTAAFATIIATATLYSKDTVFPGMTALPPVLATAVLIHCAQGTWPGYILALKGPVTIGLISYSLYLWHWPLIIFIKYYQDEPLTPLQTATLIPLLLIIAWLSWRYIERPFRSLTGLSRTQVFIWSAGGIAALSALAIFIISLDGWPGRLSDKTARYASGRSDFSPVRHICVMETISRTQSECILGAAVPPSIMIWGDSHGSELAWVLGEQLKMRGQSIVQRTYIQCPPGMEYHDATNPQCSIFNRAVMKEINNNPSIKTVYLAGYWADDAYRKAGMVPLMDQTIAQLQQAGKNVVLIGPVPLQPFDVPKRLALFGPDIEPLSRAAFAANTDWFTESFPRWRARGVRIFEPAHRLIRGEKTIIAANGRSLYCDTNHLSLAGARYVLAEGPEL